MSTDILIIRRHEVDRQNIKFEVKQAKNIVFDFLTEMSSLKRHVTNLF